jgi:hypothetical protein
MSVAHSMCGPAHMVDNIQFFNMDADTYIIEGKREAGATSESQRE